MQDKPMYKTNFSTVSSLRRGNGQVGSMQNIVVAYFGFNNNYLHDYNNISPSEVWWPVLR